MTDDRRTHDQAAYATPVIASILGETQVISYNVPGVVGLRRSDRLERWRVPVKTSLSRHVTTPVILKDTVVVSSHQAGQIGIRVSHEGDRWTATNAWTSRESAINYSSPVAVGGFLYCVGPGRNVICVEITTGRLRWTKTGVFQTSADKAHGGFIVMGDRILILTDSGELVLFKASPEVYEELGRVQVCALNWCNPAYAAGVVYLRDGLRKDGQWKAVRILDGAR